MKTHKLSYAEVYPTTIEKNDLSKFPWFKAWKDQETFKEHIFNLWESI